MLKIIKKIFKIIEIFFLPIIIIIAAFVCWFKLSDSIGSFKTTFVATILGVGATIFFNESFKTLQDHKRIKKTFGFLKLVTIPYIKGEAETTLSYLDNYKDINNVAKAKAFAINSCNFIELMHIFDKSWLNLIYSQEFLDTIKTDDVFNKISHAIFEVLLFTTNISKNCLNLKKWQTIEQFDAETQKIGFIEMEKTRSEMNDSANKLLKYVKILEYELDFFLNKNGTTITFEDR
jgi:hypothetical protein